MMPLTQTASHTTWHNFQSSVNIEWFMPSSIYPYRHLTIIFTRVLRMAPSQGSWHKHHPSEIHGLKTLENALIPAAAGDFLHQLSSMSESFFSHRKLSDIRRKSRTMSLTPFAGHDPYMYTSGKWVNWDEFKRTSHHIVFNFSALCDRAICIQSAPNISSRSTLRVLSCTKRGPKWTWNNISCAVRCFHWRYKKKKTKAYLEFPAYGSLYFSDGPLESHMKVPFEQGFCIGPHCSPDFWNRNPEELELCFNPSNYCHTTWVWSAMSTRQVLVRLSACWTELNCRTRRAVHILRLKQNWRSTLEIGKTSGPAKNLNCS